MKKKLIGIFVCIIMIGAVSFPVSGIIRENSNFNPLSYNEILYVGGTGEGNYTKIQDAIDNTSDGDTVYVFDESSPYFENVIINKAITLIGENRETTIINGSQNGNVVFVTFDGVTISGFTIENGKSYINAGIDICANYTTISNNIIMNNFIGVAIWDNNHDPNYNIILSYNEISDNLIISNYLEGIWLSNCKNSIVKNNILIDNGISSIHMSTATNNIISGNEISNSDYGISLYDDSNNNEISRNNFVSSERYCILILDSGKNNISQNNFLESGKQNVKLLYFIWTLWKLKRNKWNGNYWGISKEQPHIIIRRISLRLPGRVGVHIIPSINFDWNPAKEPYNI
jgi:parallel beta-helix repeat protein